ncbi:hypothetical protein [Mesoplasma melaleucae]|uniref:Uncharacterized protein n=1 Tax=Mesoplasma melaleucae TaxID=81459 RepID=A0A2K8NVM0_9MOLU|nr:hypothetical protein [Mesoplasma melaleucae]ATZ17794.1 hypothetical protein EMELA_v1c02210 [Mesoplasma melaleucae]
MKKKVWIPILSIFAGLALLGAGIGVGVLIPRTTATIKPNWEKPFWVKINDWEINKNAVENIKLVNKEELNDLKMSYGLSFTYNLGSVIENYKIFFTNDYGDEAANNFIKLQNILNKDSKESNATFKPWGQPIKLYLNNEYLKNI